MKHNYAQPPTAPFVVFSLLLHIGVFIIIPLLSQLVSSPQKFHRPQTFQIVPTPQPAKPEQVQKPAPKPAERQVPTPEKKTEKPKPAKPEPKPAVEPKPTAPAENQQELDELSDLLGGLSAPTNIAAVSEDFTWHWYLNAIDAKIERNWKPATQREGISVVVEFTILADGSARGIRLKKSSGIASLDNLGLRAVTLAAPFGKLPPQYPENELTIVATLRPVTQ